MQNKKMGDYVELHVEGELVEQVRDFVYLGATISCNGLIERDLYVRIQKDKRSSSPRFGRPPTNR